MSIQSILQNPSSLRIALLVVAAALVIGYFVSREILKKKAQRRLLEQARLRAAAASRVPSPEAEAPPETGGPAPAATPAEPIVVDWSQILQERPSLLFRAMRGGLILLAMVVAAGFALILLPENTIQKVVQTLQASKAADLPPEKIALLYLGDEIKGKEFHIRGIIRNITNQPVDNVDAMVRLYSPDGSLLETALVRMERDRILPDDTAEFHLVYPNYAGQFGSYSVDFKLRQGEPVLSKDRRGAKHLY